MSLQFLTNDNPPPAQSLLQYDVEPGVVFLSHDGQDFYANLTITVFNPTNNAVDCMEFQFGFLAGAPSGNLTTPTAAGEVTASDQNDWSITNEGSFSGSGNPNLYLFTATPSGISDYSELTGGASLQFTLSNVLVDQSVGEDVAPFTIIEKTGKSNPTKQTVQGTLPIIKEVSGKLSLTDFDVTPAGPILPGTSIELSWNVVGADYWRLYDSDTGEKLYDSNTDTPKNLMSWPVSPNELKPRQHTNYQVIAWAGELSTAAFAVADVTNPRFTSIGAPSANPKSVDSGAATTLSWQTVDAQYVIVTSDGYASGQITPDTNGAGQVQVNPALTTTYTFTPFGEDGEAGESAQWTVAVNPPVINSFGASPNPFERGQAVILSWEVESATALTLNPGGVDVLGQTSYPVNPVGSVTYQLTAEGQGPPVMSALVKVNQQLETFSVGGSPQALVYDGSTYVWVLNNSDQTVTRLRAVDGINEGTFPVGSNPQALVWAAPYIWVANGFDYTVARLSPVDGSNQGTYQVGLFPDGLAYDGTYIWVSNGRDNTVTRLLAVDGSNQGTFAVGNWPVPLVYDGEYIWVADNDTPVVTRLGATDGSNPVTFQFGRANGLIGGLVYDGKYIWIALQDDGSVIRVLPSDGSDQGTFALGNSPGFLLYDGTYIWVADLVDNTVTRLRATDGSNQGTFQVGQFPIGLAYDGTSLWVANQYDNTVMRIRLSDWPPPSDNS